MNWLSQFERNFGRNSQCVVLGWPAAFPTGSIMHPTTLFVSLFPYLRLEGAEILRSCTKNILPSSLSIYSSTPKTKRIIQFLWGILEARPSQPILKNCQDGTFLPVDEIWIFFGPNDFIWSAMKVPFRDFIQNVSQAPSMCISVDIESFWTADWEGNL